MVKYWVAHTKTLHPEPAESSLMYLPKVFTLWGASCRCEPPSRCNGRSVHDRFWSVYLVKLIARNSYSFFHPTTALVRATPQDHKMILLSTIFRVLAVIIGSAAIEHPMDEPRRYNPAPVVDYFDDQSTARWVSFDTSNITTPIPWILQPSPKWNETLNVCIAFHTLAWNAWISYETVCAISKESNEVIPKAPELQSGPAVVSFLISFLMILRLVLTKRPHFDGNAHDAALVLDSQENVYQYRRGGRMLHRKKCEGHGL